ncbi:hypothetical protein [Aureibacter tunicatorum]|uniref:Uncharacterized protein n=1 Tax=Aureibacter tunicatorum TaxID=866807 RepID=A0AAE3XQP1_9BACT|nr:hypothetical protein [Aureibacter tunicatorum]MDR6241367.1 hypothetical protein [Aureibacter tunicatorum]BDD06788.1 hypothetical protein AUTU_42710 [Aureibacter tunicatorum]
MQRAYYEIIELPIYNELNWDMDLIIKCLEYLRLRISDKFSELPDTVEYDLLAMTSFTGGQYPVIGMYSENESDFDSVPSFSLMYELIEQWIDEIGIESLKKEALQIETIDWEDLKWYGSFPDRNQ